MKVTDSGSGGGYAYISSHTYPRLRDLMNRTCNIYVWVNPQTANDAVMQLYTINAASTEQTDLITSTANPAGKFTLIKAENLSVSNDVTEIQIRFIVTTASQYVYFDNARVNGLPLDEYLLPDEFVDGHLAQVHVQTMGLADFPCDDLRPRYWEWQPHRIVSDGSNRFVQINTNPKDRLIGLRGIGPLESLSADDDTVTLDAHRIPLLIAYAKLIFADMEKAPVSAEDVDRFRLFKAEAQDEINRLSHLVMKVAPELIRTK